MVDQVGEGPGGVTEDLFIVAERFDRAENGVEQALHVLKSLHRLTAIFISAYLDGDVAHAAAHQIH